MVSKLLAGERVHRIDLAKRIERESAEWPDGPIVVDEWHEGPAADSGNNPERAAS
jgi:hypothetical protein